VSGLPTDIEEEDLEVLFVSQGSIKKIKIYSAPDGTKKGDALITYTRAEAASMACIQYNNLNIGEGCIISVTRASFTVSEKSRKEDEAEEEQAKEGIKIEIPEQNTEIFSNLNKDEKIPETELMNGKKSEEISNDNNRQISNPEEDLIVEKSLRNALPADCLANEYPVTLLSKVYNPYASECTTDPNFFGDLEADMLVECCKFGRVISLILPEGDIFDSLGCIAVTFETVGSARECASSLHGRWFDSRQIETLVFSPPIVLPTLFSSHGLVTNNQISIEKMGDENHTISTVNIDINDDNIREISVPEILVSEIDRTKDIAEEPDVDDFLNSFL